MPNFLKALIACSVIGLLFYPAFVFHYDTANNTYVFGDDARQYLPPFDLYDRKGVVPSTYIKDYYNDAIMFPGYKLLYKFAAKYWDTHEASRYIPYALYLFTIGILTYIAGRIGGITTAICVLVLLLSSRFIYQWGFLGGTSRMFSYTFISLTLLVLHAQKPYILAFFTVLSSLFYPLASAICGLTLALWLLLVPQKFQGQIVRDWSMLKKVIILTIAGMLTLSFVLPTMLKSGAYGPRVVSADVSNYPEASNNGRYTLHGDALPYPISVAQPIRYFMNSFLGTGSDPVPFINLREKLFESSLPTAIFLFWIVGMVILVLFTGNKYLIKSKPSNLLLLLPFFASIIFYVLAHVFSPKLYIPGRFLVYSIPLAATFLFPIALYGLSRKQQNKHAHAIIWGPILAIFLFFGGKSDGYTNWHVIVPEIDRGLYTKISTLPTNILIAGWPYKNDDSNNPMDNIPYLSQRNVFLNHETHQVLHMEYMQNMRRRMDALVAAYFAIDQKPLKYLSDEYGVTHLLINKNHYSTIIPSYFMPWTGQIEQIWKENKNNTILANTEIQQYSLVFEHNEYVLLDIERIITISNKQSKSLYPENTN